MIESCEEDFFRSGRFYPGLPQKWGAGGQQWRTLDAVVAHCASVRHLQRDHHGLCYVRMRRASLCFSTLLKITRWVVLSFMLCLLRTLLDSLDAMTGATLVVLDVYDVLGSGFLMATAGPWYPDMQRENCQEPSTWPRKSDGNPKSRSESRSGCRCCRCCCCCRCCRCFKTLELEHGAGQRDSSLVLLNRCSIRKALWNSLEFFGFLHALAVHCISLTARFG